MAFVYLFFALAFQILSFATEENTNIPTNCVGLADGTHMLRLINSDEYPIIEVQCSNEYIIIDYSKDSNWDQYFTSWLKYHYAIAGPSRNDHSTWDEWYLPSVMMTKYLISPSCDVCDEDSDIQKWSTQSTYYMSSLAFGCFDPVRGWPACDMDFISYSCKLCEWNKDHTQIYSFPRNEMTTEDVAKTTRIAGICDFEIRPSLQTVIQLFENCQAEGKNSYKPSIGLDGRYCVCVKSHAQVMTTVKRDALENALADVSVVGNKVKSGKIRTSVNTEILLYQKDFKMGTYRITKPGTYKIMEDIEFDFNAGTTDYPLADDAWWPKSWQDAKYDGAGDVRGPYFLGFFAGIAIECSDVVLDLQSHTLQMSKTFFFSQAYFSIIELASQAFLPQQGPGFFGSDPKFASHTIIKNGVLGLSSHHGIHGNYNEYIQFLNLRIRDFGTHGIQLNGYKNVLIKDVIVGPSSDQLKLNGNYMQFRQILPTLRKIAIASAGETITFSGRSESVSMQDILDIIEPMMTKAFNWAVYGTDYSFDRDWPTIESYFVNPTGYPFGAVVYGIFLNYPSAGIFGWHVNDVTSYNAKLENVKVMGLRHSGLEVLGLAQNGRVFCNAFNGPLPLRSMIGEELVAEWCLKLFGHHDTSIYAPYIGDLVSDTWIAMYYFGDKDYDNWPGIPFVGAEKELLDWVQDSDSEFFDSNGKFFAYCNEDAMFHPAKGLLGIKISGAELISMKNVIVDDLKDSTPLGSNLCGVIDKYHFAQQLPYQIGFSMNMVHGITVDFIKDMQMEDIQVSNIYSDTGLTFGIATWFENDITLSGNIVVKEMEAGLLVADGEFDYGDRPNKAPEACAIRMYNTEDFHVQFSYVSGMDESKIQQSSIVGKIGCMGKEGVYTMVGSIDDSSESSTDVKYIHKSEIKSVSEINDFGIDSHLKSKTFVKSDVQFGSAWGDGKVFKAVEKHAKEFVSGISDEIHVVHGVDDKYSIGEKVFGGVIVFLVAVLLFCFAKVYKDIGMNVNKIHPKYRLVGNEDNECYGSIGGTVH